CCLACSVSSDVVLRIRPPSADTLFPYTTLFRSEDVLREGSAEGCGAGLDDAEEAGQEDHGPDAVHVRQARADGRADPRLHLRRRSEEHTSELQSRENLVCRLLLGKKQRTDRSGN